MFSPTHLLAAGICVCSARAIVKHFRHLSRQQRKKMLKRDSLVPLVLEGVQDGILIRRKKMSVQYLPLHLCGQAMFIEPLHAFMKDGKMKKDIGNMIYSLFLPGAAMALVFPGWNDLPLMNGISLKKYAAHFYLVMYGVLLHEDKQICLDKKIFWKDLSYLYGSALILWPFNRHFHTNYLYTYEPVDPLRWVWEKMGKPAYIALMMTAGVFLVSMMYLIDGKSHENIICNQ